jgi:outer membrane immunogenic protein
LATSFVLVTLGANNIARAADMAPLPKAPPPAVFSWTGCYLGGHVGWGWGRTNLTDQSVLNLGGPPLSVTEFSPIDNNGALFGGQLGCNYQFAGNWVAGIEGSLAATNFNGVGHESTFEVAFGGVGDDTVKVKKDWLASVTGRLGVAPWDPRTLFYVKGGAAWTRDVYDLNQGGPSSIEGNCAPCRQTRTGWTLGAGVEWAFAAGWSAFAEFDHYDFGSKRLFLAASPFDPAEVSRVDVSQRIETVKIGLNYHIGAGAASVEPIRLPVKAPSLPTPALVSWTSCYAGAHTGWGWGRKNFHETEFGGGATPVDISPGFDTSGQMLGGQLGCNYQFAGYWVAGIEGSVAATDINGTGNDPFFPRINDDVLKVKTDWLASVTGRLGIAGVIPQTLLYVKGGAAWTHDIFDLNQAARLLIAAPCSPCDQTRNGWTIGGGFEWAFAPGWSAFVEYDHYDFGNKNLLVNSEVRVPADVATVDVKQRIETVKVGLNYHFGAAAPAAATMPLKATYKAPPVVAMSWTGCYAGAHLGWGWGRKGFHETNTGADVVPPVDVSPSFDTSGGVLGGQLGCNYQFATNWVAGIEGSLAAADINGTGHDPFFTGIGDDVLKVKTDWLASVTGRFGVAGWIPQTLLYVKGGAAWTHDVYDLNQAASLRVAAPCSPCDQTRTGWTIGGGAEWAFAPGWSAFVEYDHYDFGNKQLVTGPCTAFTCGGPPVPDATIRVDVTQRIEAVKLGVNYKFDWSRPVVASY